MKAIPWEDSLTSEQQSLLVGSLLGDARLECRSVTGTARLRIHHADRQRDLLFWKYHMFQSWVKREPWRTDWKDKRNGKIYSSLFFHTRTSSHLTPWWKLFYPNGSKIIPVSIDHYLNPLALAVWCMDDGCFQPESIILNTQSFSLKEHIYLQKIFMQKFGVQPSLHRDRKNMRLYFGKKEKRQLMAIIQPFLLPAFYKSKTIPVTTDS